MRSITQQIRQGDVFLFLEDMDRHVSMVTDLWVTLSNDERKRADRFKFDKDRTRFIISRGTLRKILGHFIDTKPAKIKFSYAQNGKPVVIGQPHDKAVFFNLAHSDKMALYAFALGRELGVDIERIRRVPCVEGIVDNLFTENEKAAFSALPHEHRIKFFYRLWTRKEALVKAVGEGLFHPLSGFDVIPAPGKPTRHLNIESHPGTGSGWSIHDIKTTKSFAAAIAVEGGLHTVRWLQRSHQSDPKKDLATNYSVKGISQIGQSNNHEEFGND